MTPGEKVHGQTKHDDENVLKSGNMTHDRTLQKKVQWYIGKTKSIVEKRTPKLKGNKRTSYQKQTENERWIRTSYKKNCLRISLK